MAKPKATHKVKRCSVYLRESVYKEVVMLLEDPLEEGKIPYGELSRYVNTLIAQDLRDKNLMGQAAFTSLIKSMEPK